MTANMDTLTPNTVFSTDIANLDPFLYGCLFHFMGSYGVAGKFFDKTGAASEYAPAAKCLRDYQKADGDKNKAKALEGLFVATGSLIGECEKEDVLSRRQFQYDHSNFKNPDEIKKVLSTIFLYLLRGHCRFWSRKQSSIGGYSGSTSALNDLHQADALLHDLFFGFRMEDRGNHYIFCTTKLQQFVFTDDNYLDYGSLICLLQPIIDIFKGNICKQINFNENALDYYYRAIRSMENLPVPLEPEPEKATDPRLFCSTFYKTHFEASKLLFDRGSILESLIQVLSSMSLLFQMCRAQCLVTAPQLDDQHRAWADEDRKVTEIREILKNIGYFSGESLRRDMVLSLFIKPYQDQDLSEMFQIRKNTPRKPIFAKTGAAKLPLLDIDELRKTVTRYFPEPLELSKEDRVLSDIVARLGFILFTIRERPEIEKFPYTPFFSQSKNAKEAEGLCRTIRMKGHASLPEKPENGCDSLNELLSDQDFLERIWTRDLELSHPDAITLRDQIDEGRVDCRPFLTRLAMEKLYGTLVPRDPGYDLSEIIKKIVKWNDFDSAVRDEIGEYLRGFGKTSELGDYTYAILYPGGKARRRDADRLEAERSETGKPEQQGPEVGTPEDLRAAAPALKSATFKTNKIERLFSYLYLKHLPRDIKKTEELKWMCANIARLSLVNVGNIASIPGKVSRYLEQEGYKTRQKTTKRPPLNKFVVLRRWQSFNPKVPRPKGQDIRGGGYFLFWEGKGLVIDPGYDFVQNFYEQGFSIEDIDAIVVTHTHPDHEDELNTILTLVEEWNQVQEARSYFTGKGNAITRREKHLDLFLNEGAYRKYSNWLHAKKIRIRKIFLLQSSRWEERSDGRHRADYNELGSNQIIDLLQSYHMRIEVIPAWHDELIDKYSSVGFIFHLFDPEAIVRFEAAEFTGPAAEYVGQIAELNEKLKEKGLYTEFDDSSYPEHIKTFEESLGNREGEPGSSLEDLRERRKLNRMVLEHRNKKLPRLKEKQVQPVVRLGVTGDTENYSNINEMYKDVDIMVAHLGDIKLRELMTYTIKGTYETFLRDLLKCWFCDPVVESGLERSEAGTLLEEKKAVFVDYLVRLDLYAIDKERAGMEKDEQIGKLVECLNELTKTLGKLARQKPISRAGKALIDEIVDNCVNLFTAYALRTAEYRYKNHLGVTGVYDLFCSLRDHEEETPRLMIVGELPEELQSYRHIVACALNELDKGTGASAVTGDIGLTIGLPTAGIRFGRPGQQSPSFAVRCQKCYENNECLRGEEENGIHYLPHYHAPADIQETPVKALDSQIVWFCLKHHASIPEHFRHEYFTSPELRLIW